MASRIFLFWQFIFKPQPKESIQNLPGLCQNCEAGSDAAPDFDMKYAADRPGQISWILCMAREGGTVLPRTIVARMLTVGRLSLLAVNETPAHFAALVCLVMIPADKRRALHRCKQCSRL
jgi:hypothetical protein